MAIDNGYFFEYMQDLLGERYDGFMRAYKTKPRQKALRVNTCKIDTAEFEALTGVRYRRNPLCPESLYCDVKPSLDPLYHAGLYYMQEPSASAAVSAFSPYIGERVLDLCAAPGGKSTQAAAFMTGGVLFCNDAEYKRTRALCDNIARLGVRNAVVTCNTAADYLAAGFRGYFDTLIADVPCSGGGMMRYEKVPYSQSIVAGCAARQRALLKDAAELLCGGGHLLYSTCTFSKEENEDNIGYLISLGFDTVDIPLLGGAERGIGVADARRVYPFDFDGEGHFYCVLAKRGDAFGDRPIARTKQKRVAFGRLELSTCEVYGRTVLGMRGLPVLDGLNAIEIGVPVFDGAEPSYALVHALSREETELFGTAEIGERASEYIAGKQLEFDCSYGLKIATVNGYALGLCKSASSGDGTRVLKNKYPKKYRI